MKANAICVGKAVAVAIVLTFFNGLVLSRSTTPAQKRAVTESIKNAVVQAIQDELYDFGCQSYGFDAAEESGDDWYQLRAYVKPELLDDNQGEVIYKFLPLGEVIRVFSMEHNGLVVLYGHPEWKFPPTSSNFLTVYMDDDELCQHKHDWLRVNYRMELKPGATLVRQAAERQRRRLGAGYRVHRRDCSFK